ncbi:peptide MFS transporter [Novosphingobium sp. FKTRR1]|uniref:peptide MFS transporter n=1 Tax=Novosphingobium sp. FKTRR1 TaxID=2879118 RepID=UPI001CEFEA44|nr:peptide MFS transporter [Novosphingobium sp. FKTRR1]
MSTEFSDPSDWFGQPRGLTVLFATEMWEKFSFYGMRALLVYYMTKSLAFSGETASMVYGFYTAFIYFTPIIGGAISDRWLRRRTGVIIGGAIMALGHFLMAFPALLFVALGTIAIGNGFYLPNLPSQIDQLYQPDDPRRQSTYNIYYVGVNLGAFIAPLVCGTLGEVYGWDYGFGAAGLGMCLGLAIYCLGSRWLPDEASREHTMAGNDAPPASLVQSAGRLRALAGVFACVVVFRGAYEQMGNSVALWADTDVNRSVAGYLIPGSWFQSLNPLLVFALTPVLVAWWNRSAMRDRDVSPLQKMALGALGLALAYLGLAGVVWFGHVSGAKPPALALAGFIGAYTLAELYILPVGLGLFSQFAPEGHRGTMVATWFLAAFFGNLLAGYLGSFWPTLPHTIFFALLGAIAMSAAAGLRLFDKPVREMARAIGGQDPTTQRPLHSEDRGRAPDIGLATDTLDRQNIFLKS